MTKADIQKTIKDLEGGIASPSVPDRFKENMRKQVEQLKIQLASMEKSTPTPKKPKSDKRTFMNDFRNEPKTKTDQEIAEFVMDQYNQGLEEFELESASDVLEDQDKQEKLIKFLNRRIVPFYKKDVISEDVRDILEDENYHLLNEYLGLSGLYGEETQKYYLTFKKKHGGSDWKKKQLNPKFFGLEFPEEEPKKKGVPLPKEKQSKDDEYDCDELYEKEKQRRAKAKERASRPKKTDATKNKEKLEKVFENVKERAMEEEVSKSELEKLISSTEALLKMLKDKLAKMK